MPDFGQIGRNLAGAILAESPVGILLERQDPGQLAKIWLGRPASGQLAEIRPFCADSGHFAGICMWQI
jgi:hypothetical protein